MTLRVRYYAALREASGRDEEVVVSFAATAADLYREVALRHRIPYGPAALTVAVNDTVVPWSSPLGDGDTVVFLAPYAGG